MQIFANSQSIGCLVPHADPILVLRIRHEVGLKIYTAGEAYCCQRAGSNVYRLSQLSFSSCCIPPEYAETMTSLKKFRCQDT